MTPLSIWVDRDGHFSMIRLGVFIAIVLGGVAILAGLVGWFLKLPDATVIVGAGTGLITLALGAKMGQSFAENSAQASQVVSKPVEGL